MFPSRVRPHLAAGLALTVLCAGPATAQSARETFHEAYYLEHEKGDVEAALALYQKVENDRGAPEDLRAAARRSAVACTEELACSDFARLVPDDTIVYVELNRPGAQLQRLLSQLGLMNEHGVPSFGVSPRLIEGVLGMRGAAVAVTHIDPTGGPPNGVMILHPGDLDVVRGLIETALPVGAQPSEAIGGFPTYSIEGQVLVTVTSRLVIASPDPAQIRGVIGRLNGHHEDSLASHNELASAMRMRGDDLVYFCVNAEPVMPMIQNMVAAEARNDPGAMMALSLLDLDSTRSLAGRVGVGEDGISVDLALDLAEGHHNLAFNLMRKPRLERSSLAMIPAGVAFFCASSLNPSGKLPPAVQDASGAPIVTMMDFGREVFGNIADVAVYGMPSVSSGPMGPMPDVALAIKVNDPARSRALWNLVLGVAKGAMNGGHSAPAKMQVAGVEVERYDIQGVPVFLAVHGDQLLISPSETAIVGTMQKRRAGESVLQDPVFASSLQHFNEGCVFAAAVNAGRASEIARHFMSPNEQREMQPFVAMLRDTAVALSVQHSATRLGVSARVSGIPDVSPVVSDLVARELGHRPYTVGGGEVADARGARPAAGTAARPEPRPAPDRSAALQGLGYLDAKDAPAPKPATDKAAEPADLDALVQAFEDLNAAGRVKEARAAARRIHEAADDDAFFLNNFAWKLLTEDAYGENYLEVATAMTTSSNAVSTWTNWLYLDTYAHAMFAAGRVEEAIDVEKKAIAIATERSDPRVGEAEEALKRFMTVAGKTAQETKPVEESKPEKAKPAEKAADPYTKEAPAPSAALASELLSTFNSLHAKGDHAAAKQVLAQYAKHAPRDDANALNTFAWNLLTEAEYGNHYDAEALAISKVSNEISDWSNWYALDTYAHGLFQAGDLDKAIEIQTKAVEVGREQGDPRVGEAEAALKRFQEAKAAKPAKKKTRVIGAQ